MSPVPDAGCCDATCTTGRLRVVGIVLAAGEGRRLGCRPKGLITVNGETLLSRNVRVLFEAGVDEVIVVTGHYSEQLETVLAGLSVRQTCQPGVVHSQRDSLCLGLAELPGDCDAVLVMPVDMPSLTRDDVVALIAAYKHAAPEIALSDRRSQDGQAIRLYLIVTWRTRLFRGRVILAAVPGEHRLKRGG